MIAFKDISSIYNRLSDNLSKEIFNTRLTYAMGECERWDFPMNQINEPLRIEFFPEYMKNRRERIVVFGFGKVGKYTARLLKKCGYFVYAFCDSKSSGGGQLEIEGTPVLSFSELCKHKDEYIIVIGSINFTEQIYEQCLWYGFKRENIFYPPRRFLLAFAEGQYFDFFEAGSNEVFVDCGAWNGATSVEFTRWAGENYEKIYLFEAIPENKALIQNNLREAGVSDYELIMKGAWSMKTNLTFSNTLMPNAKFDEGGNYHVPVTSIDQILEGQKATFIKMDIEGSEYQAILGAQKTIKACQPRLAISVYHKKMDFFELPKLVLSINSNYQLAYRTYASAGDETILYAWPESGSR